MVAARRLHGWARTRQAVALLVLLTAALAFQNPAFGTGCPERPACKGCGCKGGPGYRGPDGKCVGFKALDKICGVPPETRCIFENAPGTGANHDCALAPKKAKGQTPLSTPQ